MSIAKKGLLEELLHAHFVEVSLFIEKALGED